MQCQPEVVVVGVGGIGLPLAVALARRGCNVLGYDIDENVIADLRRHRVRRFEPGLADALGEAAAAGAISFDAVLKRAGAPRAYFITVPTPLLGSSFDDRPLRAAIETLQRIIAPGDLVVLTSTVPIGTTRSLGSTLRAVAAGLDVAYCPDRTITGNAFAEQFSIPHIVGGLDERSSHRAAEFLGRLGSVINVSSAEVAEAVKLFANSQRDVLFGLANEYALICEQLGLDLYEIAEAGSVDYPRSGLSRPGPVGGQCLPKDTYLLASSLTPARSSGVVLAARHVNESVIARIRANGRRPPCRRPRGARDRAVGRCVQGRADHRRYQGQRGAGIERFRGGQMAGGDISGVGCGRRFRRSFRSGSRTV